MRQLSFNNRESLLTNFIGTLQRFKSFKETLFLFETGLMSGAYHNYGVSMRTFYKQKLFYLRDASEKCSL